MRCGRPPASRTTRPYPCGRRGRHEATANADRLSKNLVVSDQEAKLVEAMVKKGLMARTEQLRVEREQTELNGQLNLAGETIMKGKAAITEAQLQVGELGLQQQLWSNNSMRTPEDRPIVTLVRVRCQT